MRGKFFFFICFVLLYIVQYAITMEEKLDKFHLGKVVSLGEKVEQLSETEIDEQRKRVIDWFYEQIELQKQQFEQNQKKVRRKKRAQNKKIEVERMQSYERFLQKISEQNYND